jgi:hypothetical protein
LALPIPRGGFVDIATSRVRRCGRERIERGMAVGGSIDGVVIGSLYILWWAIGIIEKNRRLIWWGLRTYK